MVRISINPRFCLFNLILKFFANHEEFMNTSKMRTEDKRFCSFCMHSFLLYKILCSSAHREFIKKRLHRVTQRFREISKELQDYSQTIESLMNSGLAILKNRLDAMIIMEHKEVCSFPQLKNYFQSLGGSYRP